MRLGLHASAFDPIHPGYVYAWQQAIAAGACDAVVVAIHRDPSTDRPEKRRPALTVEERAILLREFRDVMGVTSYNTEHDLLREIIRIRPACLIVGKDHQTDQVTGAQLVPTIPVFWAKRRPEWSGTEMARRIHEAYVEYRDRQIAREATVQLQRAVQSWVAARCPCEFPAWDGSQTGGSEATMQDFGGSQGGAAMIDRFGARDAEQTSESVPGPRDPTADQGVQGPGVRGLSRDGTVLPHGPPPRSGE